MKTQLVPKIQEFKLSELNPAPYNPRTISDEAFNGLSNSIGKFGCVEPIIVNIRGGKNVIVGGHQRHRALLKLAGPDSSCQCVTVNLNEADEKLLNLSLNNPESQGEFIKSIGKYIDELRRGLPEQQGCLDLQINALRASLPDRQELNYSEVALKPYKKTHVLLSFPPILISEVEKAISKLIQIPEIEYEMAAN